MKAFRPYLLLVLGFYSLHCEGQTKNTSRDTTSKVDKNYMWSEDYDVSIIKLIANPAMYNGKHVRVVGYLNLEFEGNALYLHEEDYKFSLYKNSLWVNLEGHLEKKYAMLSNHYVVIEGIFDGGDTGHMGLFGGGIKAITRIRLREPTNKE